MIGDDIDALRNPHATPPQKAGAAADIGSWLIPEGKVAEIAAHAASKAAEVLAAHAAASGAIHAGESALAASAAWVWRRSDICRRPLSASEREGRFANHEDFAAFMGSAGSNQEWHHIVERNKEVQFAASWTRPDVMRAETRLRFEQRLQEHDRQVGIDRVREIMPKREPGRLIAGSLGKFRDVRDAC